MDQNLCISKKVAYISIFFIFILGFVISGQLILKSNQTTNSRASETKQVVEAPTPPTALQLQSAISLQASQNNEGNIELLGTPPQVVSGLKYTIYMKKSDGSLVHIKTSIVTQEQINMLFSQYWSPSAALTVNDIKNGTFYLYQTN